jgi:hypothetical protein
MPGVAGFQEYLTSLKSPSNFSGLRLLEIMATFQDSFESHMRSEVSTIANLAHHERTPKEGSAEEESTRTANDKREGNAIIKAGMTDVVPFFLFNFDCEYEDGLWKDWPHIPGLASWILMRIAKFLHPGWWKFASCDETRHRKPLYAVPN